MNAAPRNKNIEHRDADGLLHCEQGPARIKPDGSQEWLQHGVLHRADGPAVEGSDRIEYRIQGKLHRTDGPALIIPGVLEAWYAFDMPHRAAGPAVTYANGQTETWVAGKRIGAAA